MKHKVVVICGAVIGVILLLLIALPFLVDVNHFRPQIEGELEKSLGRQVEIGDLRLSILAGGVKAENISIGEDPAFGQAPFLKARSLEVGVDLLPLLFSKSLHVNSLTLNEPEVRLVRGAGGKWNYSTLGTSAAVEQHNARKKQAAPADAPAQSSSNFSVGTFRIVDGRLLIGNGGGGQSQQFADVELKASNLGYGSVIPFSVSAKGPGGGSLKASGKAGPLNRQDASETPLNASVTVQGLDIARSGFLEPGSGMAGLIDYKGTLTSNGKVAHSEGKVHAEQLRLVRGGGPAKKPVDFDYATEYDTARKSGTVQRGDIHTGSSVARLAGNYGEQGESTVVHLRLTGNSLPVADVEGLLPALGIVLPQGSSLQGGTVSTNLAMDGPLDRLVISGPVSVSNTRLEGFSMASKLKALSVLTGGGGGGNQTEIQTLSSNLRIAPEGINAENLNLVMPATGTVTGSGTVSSSNALNFHMLAKLAGGGGVVSALPGMNVLSGGQKGEIPFTITGTTSNPIFAPDIGKAVGNQISSPQGAQGLLQGIFGKKKTK